LFTAESVEWEKIFLSNSNTDLLAIDVNKKSRIAVAGENGCVRIKKSPYTKWYDYVHPDYVRFNSIKLFSLKKSIAVGEDGAVVIFEYTYEKQKIIPFEWNYDLLEVLVNGKSFQIYDNFGYIYQSLDEGQTWTRKDSLRRKNLKLVDASNEFDGVYDYLYTDGKNSMILSYDYKFELLDSIYIDNHKGEKIITLPDSCKVVITDSLKSLRAKNGEFELFIVTKGFEKKWKKPIVKDLNILPNGTLHLKVYDSTNAEPLNADYFSKYEAKIWTKYFEKNSDQIGTNDIQDVIFMDDYTGYTVNSNGVLGEYKITDINEVEYSTFYEYIPDIYHSYCDMGAYDKEHIAILRGTHSIEISKNSGKSWDSISLKKYNKLGGGDYYTDIRMLSENNIVIAGYNIKKLGYNKYQYHTHCLVSQDAGKNFKRIEFGEYKLKTAGRERRIGLERNKNGGLLLKCYTKLFYSDDLFESFKEIDVEIDAYQKQETILFGDRGIFQYLYNTDNRADIYARMSTDMGATWTKPHKMDCQYYHTKFVNEKVGYAINKNAGSVYKKNEFVKTVDSGKTWEVIKTLNGHYESYDIIAVDEKNVTIIGGIDRKIWHSDNGGKTWKVSVYPFKNGNNWIYKSIVTKNNNIIVLCSNGQLLTSKYPVSIEEVQEMQSNISISPNPISKGQSAEINIISKEDTPAEMKIFDMTGREVLSKSIYLYESENNIVSISSGKLSREAYYIAVTTDDEKEVLYNKFIVK
jgi:photosystem II stability/assembly factor-like uncharacterized protein